MIEQKIFLQTKWELYLKSLAEDHQTSLNNVVNELLTWAFSNSEGKKQFEAWLDDAYPAKGEAEDKEMDADEEAEEKEEDKEAELEEEAHEDRNYNEDRETKS
ncbi:MAG TPA: hypothetical protein VMD05_10000 [Candidatus Nanoarchaeia archaeon]|nr:hypothetical protein [Candidatus Nanoarchaeia archaeon]